ncbi:MAG: hypothetical protein A2Z99_11375 [Treponema sp. GWB1_62_6]|nr:MAG: hypothetical protein A2001_07800 [Treponema sp. GWC1_61_84]OHE67988.1 MAG: hypothetical protein A2413_14270 [Treponema sp. RIFOXYC1_FULL_61_9]OHE70103.1 MAG: hypothetical protein A2Z99_11375 [Treponema sp. GWB1_62_6]HCM25506.1 hypothetical protein [Treponema sp.]
MGCVPSITRIGTSFFLLVSLPAVVFAADVRVQPIDAFILLDRSTAMAGSVAAAGEWLCDSFVDPILMEGDRVTVWSFSDGATLIADASIGVPGSKEGLKEAIRSVSSDSGGPDFPAAIRAAARAEAARGDRNRMAVVMVASALTLRTDAKDYAEDTETASLLRFSRVEDHAGWKLVSIGLGIGESVKAAAVNFMAVAGAR